MKSSYIKPQAACIRLNLSDQLLDFGMMGYSKGAKKEDAWAKSNMSLQTEGWGDENDNAGNSQTQNKKSVWDD